MVAYLTKSYVSEGFNQIIDFLNGCPIKYALTVNPNIYVLCIKQLWTTVAVKKVNDVIRLPALVNKKKVVVTEATIREELCLDDAEGVDCLTNEELFAELARMGYEKPTTKLTFYKAFFSSQWKFLIHIILQCMSAKRTSWNKYSSSMASVVICLSSGDLSTHSTKYTSPALTHKVFANMRRVGKGFSSVETPLFESILVEQQVDEERDADKNVEEVNVGDAAKGDDSAAHGEVPTVAEEPSIPSPTPSTLPPQPSQDIPTTSQVQPTLPQSPQVQPPSPQPQPQPQQGAEFPMNLLQEVMNTCATLTKRVDHLEFDKVAQAIKITKLKQRRVETSNETMMDDESNQGRIIAEMDQDADFVLEDDREVADAVKDVEDAKVNESVNIQERQAESQAEIYKIDLDHANKVLSMQEDGTKPAEDKGKGILVEEPKPLKKKQKIEQDEQYARELHAELNKNIDWDKVINHVKIKAKDDPAVKKYQALKRKPQTEAQARKNMMLYLKNVAGFKMNYFKGMSYDDICPIFEAKFNSNVDFLLKTKEQIEEDENRALQRLNETLTERAAKRRKLNKEVEELKRHLQIEPNEDDDTEAQAKKNMMLYLKNVAGFKMDYFKGISYDDIRPIFEAKFKSNVDFLLKIKEQIEEDENRALQRLNETLTERAAKRQKVNEEIITFTTTQLILLVERKYPLTRFTLDQMLNAVRLAVEEESEVSLELLRFIRQQHQKGQLE
nr:hypothetical protein [Tanacetum cinerariifolium]